MPIDELDAAIAEAIIGIDTLWGGDVMNPSGAGRFIADSWFSDQPLPPAYAHASAAALRSCGGVGAGAAAEVPAGAYLGAVDLRGAIGRMLEAARAEGGLRGAYLEGLSRCCEVMLDLAMEVLGRGPRVPYERCVHTLTGTAPSPSEPEARRRRVADLLAAAGHAAHDGESLLTDSFQDNLLGAPCYTRPAEFRGMRVPDVLLSGNHDQIRAWREEQQRRRTAERRDDLLEHH